MLSPFKPQTKDYNCGPTALCYFLHMHGIEAQPDILEDHLGTTPEDGTSHEGIVQYLRLIGFPLIAGEIPLHQVRLPMLVNFWEGTDGHYAVIEDIYITTSGTQGNRIYLRDPADGLLHIHSFEDFTKNWYSLRYGKNWGLCKA